MESIALIKSLQERYRSKLILTGLAALQSPAVQTRQLTFYNPSGNKEDYFVGRHHVLIKRATKKTFSMVDHLLFIARHIELYADEINQLAAILPDISLTDLRKNDKPWRIFAYLKKHILGEDIELKKSIGRRMIDIGDVTSQKTVRDNLLHIRDALLLPAYRSRSEIWTPQIGNLPDRESVDKKCEESKAYFDVRKVRPLFNKFCRYGSRLESAASAKIEGYDAKVEIPALSQKLQERMKSDVSLRAHFNMDNLHRDIAGLSKEPITIDLICNLQKAIVEGTWRNKEEMADKTPGYLRPFGEVIVDRSKTSQDNVVYVAPKHHDVEKLLRELIDFYYRMRNSMHPLDIASIFKYQLILIHPFGDGNGRLARWFFQFILIRDGYTDSVHQVPISHIFLNEKNRYYDEIARVDKGIMEKVGWELDPGSNRYRAIYNDLNVYRSLDYSSWIAYVYDAFIRAVDFSMEENAVFERTERLLEKFEKELESPLQAIQRHEALRAIDIGFRNSWGKKTEKRLLNNGFDEDEIVRLKQLVDKKWRS